MKGLATAASLAVILGATGSLAIQAVTVKGNGMLGVSVYCQQLLTHSTAFYAGNERFYVKGVDYQPGGSSDAADPIADETVCKRDIAEYVIQGQHELLTG